MSKLLAIQTFLKACLSKLAVLAFDQEMVKGLTSKGGLGTGLQVVGDGWEEDDLALVTEKDMPCTMGGI